MLTYQTTDKNNYIKDDNFYIYKIFSKSCILNTKQDNVPLISDDYNAVYFLIQNEEIVYVGTTTDLLSRVAKHKKDKIFNYVNYFFATDLKHSLELETEYILEYSPKYNKNVSVAGRWASIVQLASMKRCKAATLKSLLDKHEIKNKKGYYCINEAELISQYVYVTRESGNYLAKITKSTSEVCSLMEGKFKNIVYYGYVNDTDEFKSELFKLIGTFNETFKFKNETLLESIKEIVEDCNSNLYI